MAAEESSQSASDNPEGQVEYYKTLGDALLYLVLSHFVAYLMAMKVPGAVNVDVAARASAFPHCLLPIDERLSVPSEINTRDSEPSLTLV